MLLTFQEVVVRAEIPSDRLTSWIEQKWVLPIEEEGEPLFDEADFARVELLAELTGDLEVNEEAIPVVLRLLDQVYGLRRVLREVQEAVRRLPEDVRSELEARLAEVLRTSDDL